MIKNQVSTVLLAILSSCHTAFAGGAIVLNSNECIILDGNGKEETVSGSLHTVQNANNYHYICKAQVTPPSSGHAAYFDYENTGLTCGDNNFEWHETVSTSGNAVVDCLITPAAPPKS
ncbi:hypothetical protein GJ744_009464 [Endocarpon pusillum]|uniref:AA1-like domain-containing protein n=1 Tax=Endocarpon pusillum TaxID=364733 RepID=A0A8H7E3N4_9EURO|nr:hypothetical protein GJ744_009464 [Endocarpon pusillum]